MDIQFLARLVDHVGAQLLDHFHPRIMKLFYETLNRRGNSFYFAWDGLDYELNMELIENALGVAIVRPLNCK